MLLTQLCRKLQVCMRVIRFSINSVNPLFSGKSSRSQQPVVPLSAVDIEFQLAYYTRMLNNIKLFVPKTGWQKRMKAQNINFCNAQICWWQKAATNVWPKVRNS
jgi:hypothetical protein